MKKVLIASFCASLLTGLTACNSYNNAANSYPNNKTQTATAVENALQSGIELAYFDESVRPQDDFYRYVNGQWLASAHIPADRTTTGAFYDLDEQARVNVKTIIEDVAATPNLANGTDEQKVADLYHSFMDEVTLNQLGITPINAELNTVARLKNKTELVQYFAHSQTVSINSPLAFYIDIDAKNADRYAAYIWQAGLSLPEKDYYLNPSARFAAIRAAYINHIENMFTLAGLTQPKASAQAILALETKLAEHHWDVVDNRDNDKLYNAYPVSDLPKLSQHINWQAYLTALGADELNDMIINQPSFITGLDNIIRDTDLANWKTYMQWQILTHYADNLSESFANEHFNFYAKTLNGQVQQQPRWKRGVAKVNGLLGEVVGKVYVKRHFTANAKARMQVLVENLRTAYSDSINDLSWMSPTTKAAAQEKLTKFTPKIGYPDKWEDYSELTIKPNDLIGNLNRASLDAHLKSLAKLNSPINKGEWHMSPQTVNAYYNPTMNEIVFPAAILQPPFFNMNADDAVNYGGIGAVIGHEMGHGFDDQGAKFDGNGNMRNWWNEQDLKEFSKRGQALINQYDQYAVFDDLHINGKLTLGENIGDLSGVTIAYRAYQKSLKGKPAPIIDGLTGDQRFFIGFTQIWRSKVKEETLRNRIATDPHSPAEFRVLGTLSNMPEFYNTYKVSPLDAMYISPENRVKIW